MSMNQALALAADPGGPPVTPPGDMIEIDTRFGRFALPRANTIAMPQGVLGFSNYHEFALLALPDPRFARFRILQCLAEPALSFIVVPHNLDDCGIDQADVTEALTALGVAPQDAVLLLIVTIRKAEGQVDMTVNLRAPIVLDVTRQSARQYVLSNTRYSIRQRL